MFRAVLPRATPRSALRHAGPKAVPNNFATPMIFIGHSKRGFASEAGKSMLASLSQRSRRGSLYFPYAIADFLFPGQ